jgi:hypothetical protein
MTPYTSDELRPFLSPLSFQGPLEPFLVLADWLQEREDPWGNLIAIDAALEASSTKDLVDERGALLARHGEAICPLQCWADARVVYRRGFVASAKLGDCGDTNELSVRLTALLSSSAATLVERIGLSESHLADPHAKALIAAKTRLERTHVDLRGNAFSAAIAAELKKAIPRVDVSNQKVPLSYEARYAESGSDHRAFIRHHGARSIEDIDD